MTQEDKKLLLAELSSRLIYKVHLYCENNNADVHIGIMTDLYCEMPYTPTIWIKDDKNKLRYGYRPTYDVVRLYLRPMSSMTEKEKLMYEGLMMGTDNVSYMLDVIEWLNAHYIDYRGLIEKGLAIEAPKDMYEIKEK